METLNALSARSLQYYVMAEHWEFDLEFSRWSLPFLINSSINILASLRRLP